MIDIINICDLTTETRTIFTGYPTIPPTTTDPIVDTALFMLLLSRADGYARDLIKNLTSQGCEAIVTLQRHCSQITPEDQNRIQRDLVLLQQQRNETATSYLKRVRSTIREAQNLGLPNTDDFSIVNTCLNGFNTHRRYEATVSQLKSQKRLESTFSPNKLSLSKLEAIFISLDENSYSSEKLFSTNDNKAIIKITIIEIIKTETIITQEITPIHTEITTTQETTSIQIEITITQEITTIQTEITITQDKTTIQTETEIIQEITSTQIGTTTILEMIVHKETTIPQGILIIKQIKDLTIDTTNP